MSADPWVLPTGKPAEPEPATVTTDLLVRRDLQASITEAIEFGAGTSPRSLQVTIGASEIGGLCKRQIAYRAVGTPPVHQSDPLKPIVGIGTHLALADIFRRADGGMGRYLIEEPVTYRGIKGTCDLLDRRRRVLVDWKVTEKAKIRRVRSTGPPRAYIVQANIYAAGLTDRGEVIDHIAIVYLPSTGDEGLAGMYVWMASPDRALADRAVEEFWEVRDAAQKNGPGSITPHPTRLCPWCIHYQPGSADPDRSCPDGLQEGDHA